MDDAPLAIEDTVPCFGNAVQDEHFAATLVCPPSSDESTLQRSFTTRELSKVKVLDVSNCIVAAPDVILSWVGMCPALTELRCVNCPLPFSGLLAALVEWLPHLQYLDWSFFGKNFSDDHMFRVMAPYNERVIPKLRNMYVEVACQGGVNYAYLSSLVKRCIVLEKLHLHGLYGDFTEDKAMRIGTAAFATTSDPTLIYSTELDAVCGRQRFFSSFARLVKVPSNPVAGIVVRGNLVCLRAHTAGATSSHTNTTPSSAETLRFKQVVVTLRNEADVRHRLQEEALTVTWKHVEALTITFLPYDGSSNDACASRFFRLPLIAFLSSFSVLTELNLNSFHFAVGVDCCGILAELPIRLRALSLAPCGINRNSSFTHLAKVSSKLEELDVRMNSDNVSLHCSQCRLQFRVRVGAATTLQQCSLLRRFTLLNVAEVHSLYFIEELRPTELRLSFISNMYTIDVENSIRCVLRPNENLRSLVLRDHAVFGGLMFYQENLDVLSGLNHLSLDVSVPAEPEEVQSFFGHMTARLPVLGTLHLHYVGGDGCVRTLTWLRQPDGHRDTRQEDRRPAGTLLADRPCIGCSLASFIGLAKPRNRSKNSL